MTKFISISTLTLLAFSSWAVSQEATLESATPQQEEVYVPTYQGYRSILNTGKIGKIGRSSQIQVQEGQVYLNGSDTAKLMEAYGNLPTTYHGAIVAIDESYIITFKFDETGYVKDDEKGDLDAEEILQAFKNGDAEGNKQRKAAGMDTLTTVGWAFEPKYNESTNNLEWAIIFQSGDGSQTVNHNIKILGRKGVMDAVLLCDPTALDSLRPMLDNTLAGFEYTEGNKYAEYEEGDKIAEYGLTGLIVGGGLLAAGKLGLFALLGKFWKIIAAGLVGIGAFIVKMKNKVTGSN